LIFKLKPRRCSGSKNGKAAPRGKKYYIVSFNVISTTSAFSGTIIDERPLMSNDKDTTMTTNKSVLCAREEATAGSWCLFEIIFCEPRGCLLLVREDKILYHSYDLQKSIKIKYSQLLTMSL
jgi:hypothetical protein